MTGIEVGAGAGAAAGSGAAASSAAAAGSAAAASSAAASSAAAGSAAAGSGAAASGFTVANALQLASTLIGVASSLGAAQAQKAAGTATTKLAEYTASLREGQARSMEQNAGQERAIAQRTAEQQRRAGRLLSSRAQAISAASGAGALDPTVIDLLAGIDRETDVRASNALYAGEERAKGLEYGAILQRAGAAGDLYAGQSQAAALENAANRSSLQGAGTAFGGFASIYDKYRKNNTAKTLVDDAGGLSRYADEEDNWINPRGYR
jgi:hypothetical protein